MRPVLSTSAPSGRFSGIEPLGAVPLDLLHGLRRYVVLGRQAGGAALPLVAGDAVVLDVEGAAVAVDALVRVPLGALAHGPSLESWIGSTSGTRSPRPTLSAMRWPSAEYEFRGTWSRPAPLEAVREAVVDLEHYPEWWPQIRAVAKLGPDDARVLCRSALPYTLDLVLHAVSREGLGARGRGVRRPGRLGPVGARAGAGGTRMEFEQQVVVSGAARARRRTSSARCCAGTTTG